MFEGPPAAVMGAWTKAGNRQDGVGVRSLFWLKVGMLLNKVVCGFLGVFL